MVSEDESVAGPLGRWDHDELAAWLSLLFTTQLLRDRLDAELRRRHGLSLEDYAVLVAIEADPKGRVRVTELAEAALLSQSRLSHQIKRMEARDLVRREQAALDKRGVEVVLTETGRELLREAAPGHIDRVRQYFLKHLSPRDRTRLTAILRPALETLATSPALLGMLPPR